MDTDFPLIEKLLLEIKALLAEIKQIPVPPGVN